MPETSQKEPGVGGQPIEGEGQRIACLHLSALPLQLLRRRLVAQAEGPLGDRPLAVVAEDHPQSPLLWVDPKAASRRVRVGMRYGAALQLAPALLGEPVAPEEVSAASAQLLEKLRDFSPRVQWDRSRVGLFWIDPSGLQGLFGPLERWARAIGRAVRELELSSAMVVGFRRMPAWAVAQSESRLESDAVLVLASVAEERQRARQASVGGLGFKTKERELLQKLAIETVGDLLDLPPGSLGSRFGARLADVRAELAGELERPLCPDTPATPLVVEAELEPPDDDRHRLLFSIKGALHALIGRLAADSMALRSLHVEFVLEGMSAGTEELELEPAVATRDAGVVLELLRLRLGSFTVPGRVERIRVLARPAPLDGSQLQLAGRAFRGGRGSDPKASDRGLARLISTLGPDAITQAEMRPFWTPEEAYRWRPCKTLDLPQVEWPEGIESRSGTLVRQLIVPPKSLAEGPDGRPKTTPPISALTGPYRLQGGWWQEQESARDYFFAEREDGALLWLFRERHLKKWFLHGHVD